jgi:two-component system, cell cycle sensor histidine kinase and response regulator CckA
MKEREENFFQKDSGKVTALEAFPGEFEKKYEILFQMYPDPILLVSSDETILDCNAALCSATGYSHEELIGIKLADILGSHTSDGISFSRLLETQKNNSVRGVCRKKNGSLLPVNISTRYLDDGEMHVFIFLHSLESINARTNVELQSQQARKFETIGMTAGGISHYFNNIFTGIMGNTGLALLQAPQSIKPLLEQVEKAACRAAEFNKRLLSFSRKSSPHSDIVDLEAIIDDVEHFIRITFDKRIEIRVDKQVSLHRIKGDSSSIHNVLLNLCVNSRDALFEARKRFRETSKLMISIEAKNTAVAPDGAKKGDYVSVSVSDTGVGMNSEIRQRLFEPFFTTKNKYEGTGLGLSTAQEIIKEHNGWFEVSSSPGKGSLFRFYLPACPASECNQKDSPAKILQKGAETVLIIDDEEMIRTFGKLLLERLGYTVITAANGRDGLDLFHRERHRINLIILDLVMPCLSGKEIFQKIRRLEPEMKIILSSGDYSQLEKVITRLKVPDYIVKPFNIYDLSYSVRKALDRK